MARLLWLSDTHFNFLAAPNATRIFGGYLKAEDEFDAVVISGDIAEAHTVVELLNEFALGVEKPVYFTTGNHDHYFGSIQEVREALAQNLAPNIVWLDGSRPVLVDQNTAVTGQQGWYDACLGSPFESRVVMSDFELIAEFSELYIPGLWHRESVRLDLISRLRELAKQEADQAESKLKEACALRENVVFVTHFPPFKGACWHNGAISDSNWLPWYTSKAMGDTLAKVAEEHPTNRILVLCGHTHSPGLYQHMANLRVLTGKAVYGHPDVAGVIDTSRSFLSWRRD